MQHVGRRNKGANISIMNMENIGEKKKREGKYGSGMRGCIMMQTKERVTTELGMKRVRRTIN